jgi:hypothetical protein
MDGAKQAPPAGWAVRHRHGDMQLLEQPAGPVGVGCITRFWTGGANRVRDRLNSMLAHPVGAGALLDPHRYTAIRYGSGEVVEAPWPDADCDDRQARLSNVSSRAGEVQAQLDSAGPVDVVFRVSAFPSWRVSIDAAPVAAWTLVAPGFISVRVPPGSHRLHAEARVLPLYRTLVVSAALATAILALARSRRSRVAGWLARLKQLRRR